MHLLIQTMIDGSLLFAAKHSAQSSDFLSFLQSKLPALIDIQLLTFLAIMALVISRMRNLFSAAMLTGIFSLICAGLFVVMDAVDVAFTEAAVGAGISTVLILGALSLTTSKEKDRPKTQPIALLVVLLTGGALIYGTLDMPLYGDASAPIHRKGTPAEHYIKKSYKETGVPNIVTSVLASYRGYDTLGETTVIFTAGLGVLLLLSGARREKSSTEEDKSTKGAKKKAKKDKPTSESKPQSSSSPSKEPDPPEKPKPKVQASKPTKSEKKKSSAAEKGPKRRQSKKERDRSERKKRKKNKKGKKNKRTKDKGPKKTKS